MKKIILTAATITALSSSTAFGMEDMFYVKANGGWSKLTKTLKLKSKNDFFLGLGVGYYVMDNVRADLAFEHLFNPEHKGSVKDEDDGEVTTYKLEGNVNALTLNGYVDLFDVSVAKFFVGAGVGMSQVSAKDTASSSLPGKKSSTVKFKKKNNFTYALHLGASTEFAPGVNGELSYSYKNFGKTTYKDEGGSKLTAKYKGHQVAVGVRFDI